MDVATLACVFLSRKLMKAPELKATDLTKYSEWRDESLTGSWARFSDDAIDQKDVLDFGCGDGQLAIFLARKGLARSITGVDIDGLALERARAQIGKCVDCLTPVRFVDGRVSGLPIPADCIDTILAFDCMEHVMDPSAVIADWHRVLRPGGRVLIEWFPFKGPWGPHMEALIPVPWAHVVFGQRAMFRAAGKIYDDPAFMPRHWDLDQEGRKKPNKWIQWETFKAQAYVNELDWNTFKSAVFSAGLKIVRLERRGFGGTGGGIKKLCGDVAMALPGFGEYLTSHYLIELAKC